VLHNPWEIINPQKLNLAQASHTYKVKTQNEIYVDKIKEPSKNKKEIKA